MQSKNKKYLKITFIFLIILIGFLGIDYIIQLKEKENNELQYNEPISFSFKVYWENGTEVLDYEHNIYIYAFNRSCNDTVLTYVSQIYSNQSMNYTIDEFKLLFECKSGDTYTFGNRTEYFKNYYFCKLNGTNFIDRYFTPFSSQVIELYVKPKE